MPALTAKAAAELLSLPAYEQLRVIAEQKYPRQAPNSYRTPFYQPALTAIRRFFRQNNDPRVIATAKQETRELRPDSKARNNLRVLDAFEGSRQFTRSLEIRPKKDFEAEIDDVVIRLAPDFLAYENGEPRVFFYNCRTVALPTELARVTIEIAHWILAESGTEIPIQSIEYVDLVEQRVHTAKSRRKGTITKLKANARVIQALWDAA